MAYLPDIDARFGAMAHRMASPAVGREDYLQIARVAAWRAPHAPRTAAWRRMVDAWRSEHRCGDRSRQPRPAAVSLDAARPPGAGEWVDRPTSLLDTLTTCDRDPAPSEWLRWAIARLPEQQQWVLRAYYWAGLPQDLIAECLGVTASRIAQIHTAALRTLRAWWRNPS